MTEEEKFAVAKLIASCPVTMDDAAVACGLPSFAAAIDADRNAGTDISSGKTHEVIQKHAYLAVKWAKEMLGKLGHEF